MQTESLRVREAEFDKLFSASFDEFQGFPWGPSEAYPTSRGNSEALETVPLPNALDKEPQDFSFGNIWPSLEPSSFNAAAQQHRLLDARGQALSLPDLASAPQEDIRSLPQLLVSQDHMLPLTADLHEEFFVGHDGPSIQSCGNRERLSSSNSEDLHPSKSMSLAERNKQAQRRHRQRQREKVGTLENQVKVLTEEKQALAAEKAALAGQAAVLTQVLQMRDEQLQQLQAAKSNADALSGAKDSSREDPAKESAVSSGLADSLTSVLTLTVREDQHIRLNPEQVRALKPQDVAKTWAEYLSAMMRHLTTAQTGEPAAAKIAEKRIADLIHEVLVLLMRYALTDLHKMKKFVAGRPSQSRSAVGLENSEMWRAAAHNMELTEQQKKALCQLRRLFMQKQEALIMHRQQSCAALQQAVPNAASSHDIAAQFLKAEEAMSAVHRNLRMENQLIVDLIYTFLVRVASPIQAARCLVQSFPWYPDTLCILTWVAAEAGDAKATELLQQKPISVQGSQQDSGDGEQSPTVSL